MGFDEYHIPYHEHHYLKFIILHMLMLLFSVTQVSLHFTAIDTCVSYIFLDMYENDWFNFSFFNSHIDFHHRCVACILQSIIVTSFNKSLFIFEFSDSDYPDV